MKHSLPPIAASMEQMAELIAAIQPEIDALEQAIAQTRAQLCVRTATTALPRYERELGLSLAGGLSDEQRRERIATQLLLSGTCTRAKVRNMIEQVGGRSVSLTEQPDSYGVTLCFDDPLGIPRYFEDIQAAARRMLPAHLGMTVTRAYRTLGEYAAWTISELGAYSFNGLNVLAQP